MNLSFAYLLAISPYTLQTPYCHVLSHVGTELLLLAYRNNPH